MNTSTWHSLTQGWHKLLRLNSNTVYAPIPKCAHTWMLRSYPTQAESTATSTDRCLILLRDPIQRWISGTGTYCDNTNTFKRELHNGQPFNWDQLFERTLILDGHTVPQTYYLRDINTTTADLFPVTAQLKQQISQYLNCAPAVSAANVTARNGSRKQITHSLTQYLQSNPQLQAQLQLLYAEDYELINQLIPEDFGYKWLTSAQKLL